MQIFLVDTNLFIAAIKSPEKKAGALDLLLELISNEEIHLLGNDLLMMEFDKYSEKFKSKITSHLVKKLKDKIVVVDVGENCIKK